MVQAESAGALWPVAEIGEVAGVDAVFIGPTDLAVCSQLGEGDGRPADLVAAAEQRSAAHHITLGTTASGIAPELVERGGHTLLVLGADAMMLRRGAQALVSAARTGAPTVG